MSRPLVIAHRGNSSAAPENTLSAFRSAIELGVDGVELDYHHSADGVPVVIHDKTLDRTTNAVALFGNSKINVADCNLSKLKQLDFGKWFADGKYAGEPLPTLDASLELICGAGKLCVIERKAGDARTLLDLLTKQRLVEKVVVMAFDWDFLEDCHQIDASLRLVALGDDKLTAERLDQIVALPAHYVGWDQKSLDAETIAAIHARGLQAWTWTVDEKARMKELIDGGIDAITSNHPGRVLEVLAAPS